MEKGLVSMAKTKTKTAWASEGDENALTLAEAAERCGMTTDGLRSAIYAGRLQAHKVPVRGNRPAWRITVAALDNYLSTGIHKQGRPRNS